MMDQQKQQHTAQIRDLPRPPQELTPEQAEKVKGGGISLTETGDSGERTRAPASRITLSPYLY
jgi:hypothetical protein